MPLRETAFQGYTFLALVYAGMLLAPLYDLALPLLNSKSWFAHLLAALALCMISSGLTLAALTLTGCSSLRFYMLPAMLTGAMIYRLGLRRLLTAPINLLRRNRNLRKGSE
ncbi:MAG: hypothetical protein IJ157_08130 [Clostridia bacterium]|nr:hypothetical protein [Clostridia bacterium]